MALNITIRRRREIALAAPCDPVYLRQVLNGHKQAAPKLAQRLVEVSDGELQLWHVRQADWWEIWPEQVGKPGAPTPGAQQSEPSDVAAAVEA